MQHVKVCKSVEPHDVPTKKDWHALPNVDQKQYRTLFYKQQMNRKMNDDALKQRKDHVHIFEREVNPSISLPERWQALIKILRLYDELVTILCSRDIYKPVECISAHIKHTLLKPF